MIALHYFKERTMTNLGLFVQALSNIQMLMASVSVITHERLFKPTTDNGIIFAQFDNERFGLTVECIEYRQSGEFWLKSHFYTHTSVELIDSKEKALERAHEIVICGY